jgi:membrane protein YdbS with pleckstrin-like domain
MGIPAKLLAEDEHVIIHVRTHWKALAAPALVLILAAAAAALVITLIPQTWEFRDWLVLGVIGAAVLLFLSAVVWPFLSWFTSTYTVTNRRIITRHGVITKTGRDIPLTRINDVSHERDLLDRILGCGTLIVWAASEQGKVVLYDVPRVVKIKAEIAQLLYASPGGDSRATT